MERKTHLPHILVSNDDGIGAPGLDALIAALAPVSQLTVVVPDKNQSAASSALTVRRSLTVTERSPNVFTVDGTPADCVHLAFTGLLERKPELLISGINAGKNLGDDVFYSGTVGAAREGPLFGVNAMAVSLVEEKLGHFETAAQVAMRLAKALLLIKSEESLLLNVNVPDCPLENLKGIEVTRLGRWPNPKCATCVTSNGSQLRFTLGDQIWPAQFEEGTDFSAVKRGYASVTTLKMDSSDERGNKEISQKFSMLLRR